MGWKAVKWNQHRNGRKGFMRLTARDWMEEEEGKSRLKWYWMMKGEAGLEEYTRSLWIRKG